MLDYRVHRENNWIQTLQTVYLCGLNQRTKFIWTDKQTGKLFPTLHRYRKIRCVDGRERRVDNKINVHLTLILLLTYFFLSMLKLVQINA